MIADHSLILAARQSTSFAATGEATLLEQESGILYGLDEVAARVWSLIQQPRKVEEIRAALRGEYAVEPEQCRRDLLALLRQLEARGLIEVRAATEG
jgi:hypothetical protein